MPFHDSVLEEIKTRIDIVELISEYIHLKRAGQNWKGLCPFHSEKEPSFIVSPAKQIYHCFGCGNGGDIFTFLVRYENLSFPEAVKTLAERAGVTLKISGEDIAKYGEKEKLLNLHKDALNFFQQHLTKTPRAMDYLRKRGIGEEAWERFAIGYAPKSWDSLLSYLKHKGYNTETIKKAGLITEGTGGYYDTFRDRVIFPIFDPRGKVIAFGGRALDESEPKYLNSPETPIFNKSRVLYGLNLAKDSIKKDGYALFMEGYLDVITAHIHGFSNSVAPLGTAITQEHGKLIRRFTEEIILVFDSDQAGIKAAKNAISILLENGLNVKILLFPEDEDPDSFLRKNGKDAFTDLLKNPLPIIEFFMSLKEDKRVITREIVGAISKIPDRVAQGYYVKMLSEKLGINELFIIEELKRIRRRVSSKKSNMADLRVPLSKSRPADEMYILKLMMQCPERLKEICSVLSAEDFEDTLTRIIFERIKEKGVDYERLLLECGDEERDLLTEILCMDDFENPERVLKDCLKRLREKTRKRLLQEIHQRIKEAEVKKDVELLKQLQLRQHELLKFGKG